MGWGRGQRITIPFRESSNTPTAHATETRILSGSSRPLVKAFPHLTTLFKDGASKYRSIFSQFLTVGKSIIMGYWNPERKLEVAGQFLEVIKQQ